VVDPAAAHTADNFDDMLEELRASDLATATAGISGAITTTTTSTAIISTVSSASSSSSNAWEEESSSAGLPLDLAPGGKEEIKISEDTIILACRWGDVSN
jgi:hypothetical protein